MKKTKILIISKDDISSWKSCQHIVTNLIQSYKLINSSSHVDTLKVEEDFSYYLALQYASQIKEKDVDTIVWVDHKPCSAHMLNALNAVYEGSSFLERPKFLIHLFGDFLLDCLAWENALLSLNEYPVLFITASLAQKKLVDKMFISKKSLCKVVPFPVDDQIFNLNNQTNHRAELRNRLNISDDEIVILYTGRISFQKNIDDLAIAFARLNEFFNNKIHLWLAGPWDDIILPYLGMRGFPGSHFTHYQSALSGYDVKNVKFLGDLETTDLLKAYHSADLFCSFSTYNDEDYGMSVAEALMTGLPCVLSNWGGFSSFKSYSKCIDLVNCKFVEVRMKVDSQQAQKKLLAAVIKVSNKEYSKKSIFTEATNAFSLKEVSSQLSQILELEKEHGEVVFSSLFTKICSLFRVSSIHPFKGHLSIYEEAYGDYYAE